MSDSQNSFFLFLYQSEAFLLYYVSSLEYLFFQVYMVKIEIN